MQKRQASTVISRHTHSGILLQHICCRTEQISRVCRKCSVIADYFYDADLFEFGVAKMRDVYMGAHPSINLKENMILGMKEKAENGTTGQFCFPLF